MQRQLLLVEDDDAIADVMRLHLAEAGFAVEREADGARALLRLERQPPDLLLLDLMLPGLDGWELCRRCRTLHPALPVIMVSARGDETNRVLGLELGADDYLAKPFSMVEMVARVRALLRRTERSASSWALPQLRFGSFRLDAVRRVLQRGDAAVPLTLREFDLLLHLARHPGRVFARGELLEQVWGTSFEGYEHTVNSHINRLRQKIEPDPRQPSWIQTVWGVGYRFADAP